MSVAAVNRTTLREQVVDKLRTAILDGTFRPGDKMAEVELAAQFGVSRGTVREAMRTLQNSGLLQGSERTSLHVRRLSPQEIAELFDVRVALEGHAVTTILGSVLITQTRTNIEGSLGSRARSPNFSIKSEKFSVPSSRTTACACSAGSDRNS